MLVDFALLSPLHVKYLFKLGDFRLELFDSRLVANLLELADFYATHARGDQAGPAHLDELVARQGRPWRSWLLVVLLFVFSVSWRLCLHLS